MVQKKKAATKASKNVLNFFSLKWYVRYAAVLLTLQAYVILEASNNVALPLVQSFARNPLSPFLTTVGVVSITLATWLAFLLLVSAASYFVVSSTGFGWYIRNLKHKVNYMRWLHHSVSTSLMIVIVSMLSGITDVLSVSLIFILSVAVNLFGLAMEVYNERKRKVVWNAYVAGIAVGLGGWVVMLATFAVTRLSVNVTLPNELLYMYIVVTLFFVAFAANMLLQYNKHGPWKDYVYVEKWYIAINLITKSALAWIVYFAYLQ